MYGIVTYIYQEMQPNCKYVCIAYMDSMSWE